MLRIFFALILCHQVFAINNSVEIDLPEEAPLLGSQELNPDLKSIKEKFKIGLAEFLPKSADFQVLFLSSSSAEAMQGKFDRVDIRFKDGCLQGLDQLNVSKGRITAMDMEFDVPQLIQTGKLLIKKIGQTSFRMKVSEEDINTYLSSNQGQLNLNHPKLEIKQGKMFFVARVKTLFFNSKVRTEGNFSVNQNEQTVDFKTDSLSLNSLPIPGFLLNNMISSINPVLKLKRFSLTETLNIQLKNIVLGDGYIEFIGG